jgi:hypothetical protein
VVAVALALSSLSACSHDDPPTAGSPTGPTLLGDPEASDSIANSADRLIFWASCKSIVRLTDDDLERLLAQGVDGFVCMIGRIRGLGGIAAFTTDDAEPLDGEAYEMQRGLRDSDIVARATQRGMKLYLGFYASNDENQRTPFVEWFDDRAWEEDALPSLESFAAFAHDQGFAGVAVDQEMYASADGEPTASWEWDYPGNTYEEAEVRAQVRERGVQMMKSLLAGFPEAEVVAYATLFPGTWEDVVQLEVNGIEDRARPMVHVDLWDGMTSVEGYRAVRFLDAIFYKTPHVRGASWDAAFSWEYNQLASVMSRRFSNWSYASSRVFASPFLWISEGTTDFERANEPEYVAEQLEAFSRWGMGREFANFAYNGVEFFDYTPYAEAMRQFSSPRLVDDEAPRLTTAADPAVSSGSNGATAALSGTAADDLAVWAVRWTNDRGGSGTAELEWEPGEGGYSSDSGGQMLWSIASVPLEPGTNTITVTADGIKGPSSSVTLTVTTEP